MKNFAISDVPTGKLNAMVKTIMAQMSIDDAGEAVRRISAGEWIVSEVQKPWTIDYEGIIHIDLPVTAGITGPEWSKMLKTSRWTDDLLNSDDFWITTGKTYKIAIIPGKLFSDDKRNLVNVREYIDSRGWLHGDKISPEVACLTRKYLSGQDIADMNLNWLIIMPEFIEDFDGVLDLLYMGRGDSGDRLDTGYGSPGRLWNSGDGFVCVVSQESQDQATQVFKTFETLYLKNQQAIHELCVQPILFCQCLYKGDTLLTNALITNILEYDWIFKWKNNK